MKNKVSLISRHPLNLQVLIVLLITSLSFISILIYLDQSPFSFFKSIFGKIGIQPEKFDNSSLYSYSEPVDHLEVIHSILDVLAESDASSIPKIDIGTDVTDKFLNYANIVEDFSSLSNLVTTWDNKYLAFNNSKLFLFQILRNKIYLRSLDVPGIENIKFAYIFKSGNILFCDYKNAYYSNDNLLTFNKSNILDVDGKQYLANDHGNFFSIGIDGRQIIDDKEIRVWGNYINYGAWQPGISRSEEVQVWYTTDEGKTIKAAYKFGYSNPRLLSRHIHAVNMCPWDNTFWVQTGDMSNECHWIQGKYNWKEDSWSWNVKASGDHMSYYKSTGFVFHNNYVFWSNDSSDPKKYGIWKTPYSNLTGKNIDTNLFEKVLRTDKEISNLVGNNEGFMIASQYFKSNDNKYKIFATYDGGLTWRTTNTFFQILNIHLPNAYGQILGNYFINQETFDAIHYWDMAPSIFINSYLKKTQLTK
ncbi:MAG: hypothetical protein A2W30_02750 [Ignavibacteria bacterium RBG_16_36_9]|nr:MAG: hypothetical protein A2W30_02750 [Ignavibacteria bacterium RBG_16_36_9]